MSPLRYPLSPCCQFIPLIRTEYYRQRLHQDPFAHPEAYDLGSVHDIRRNAGVYSKAIGPNRQLQLSLLGKRDLARVRHHGSNESSTPVIIDTNNPIRGFACLLGNLENKSLDTFGEKV